MIRLRDKRGKDAVPARDAGFVGELGLSAATITGAAALEAEPGWLYCNGAQVSRATYKRLFDRIGTTFGVGDGSTTFNLPDYRGRSLSCALDGQAAGGSRMAATAGTPAGVETVALTKAVMPKHVHGKGALAIASGGSHTHGNSFYANAMSDGGNDGNNYFHSSYDVPGPENTVFPSGATDAGLHTHPSGEFSGAVATSTGTSGTAHTNTSPVVGVSVLVRY